MLGAMTQTRRPASPARTTLNACWVLAIGWIVFAGIGGVTSQPILTLVGFLCFVGAVVTLIVGLVLRSKEKTAKSSSTTP